MGLGPNPNPNPNPNTNPNPNPNPNPNLNPNPNPNPHPNPNQGRGTEDPFEVGFSVEELQRLSDVFEIMTKWCTEGPRKALFKWPVSEFEEDKWLELRRLPPIMGFVGSGPGLVIILA